MPAARPRFGVAGYPVAHSRSPQMHEAAYAELGIDAEYLRLPIAPELFEPAVRAMPGSGFTGINVTIPHKQAAARLADRPSEAVRQTGAANTLTFANDLIVADNTDATGLIAALNRPLAGTRALVLGAGGTARAAVWALRRDGAEVSIWNRTFERAQELAARFGAIAIDRPAELERIELIVNTTSVGMDPQTTIPEALAALSFEDFALVPGQTAIDFVYGSHRPAFTQAAQRAGASVIDGGELLVRQGAASFEIWLGRSAPLDAMRNAIVG